MEISNSWKLVSVIKGFRVNPFKGYYVMYNLIYISISKMLGANPFIGYYYNPFLNYKHVFKPLV